MPIAVALRSVEVNFDRGKRHGATATLANQRVTRGRPYSVRCSVSRLAARRRSAASSTAASEIVRIDQNLYKENDIHNIGPYFNPIRLCIVCPAMH